MSRKFVSHENSADGTKQVRIYRDSETSEYVARLYENGCLNPDADCFESFNRYDRASRDEALHCILNTATAMVR